MMKTANKIRQQARRMFAISREREYYRHHQIAEICRAYLHNIARHHGKPYGVITWLQIGNKPVPREIYAH